MNPHRLSISQSDLMHRSIAFAFAFALLTASSHIALPIGPVPLTMQTLAVTLVGVFLGPRMGAAAVAAWVAAGFTGLPLFAMGNGGLAAMTGPTAGYLYSFPAVAAIAGALAARGGIVRVFAAMVVAHAACLVIGTAWLALAIGPSRAIAAGFIPFISGSFLKSALGALIIKARAQMKA